MSTPDLIVYHDGSCPVCRMEIGRYRRSVGAERIDFVDVANTSVDPAPDLLREDAMGRFHVRLPSGELKAGAAAFVEIWRVLTFWRPAALIASSARRDARARAGLPARFTPPSRRRALAEARLRMADDAVPRRTGAALD